MSLDKVPDLDQYKGQFEALERYREQFEEQGALAEKYMNEGYSPGIALVMAGDTLSQDRADAMVDKGATVRTASVQVGSFSRVDWVADQYFMGLIDVEELSAWIAELWRGADPDDENPAFLWMWRDCSEFVGDIIIDEKPLPEGDTLTIYRGQLTEYPPKGLSWSLSKEVAKKFAMGAAVRSFQDGFLATSTIDRKHIIAYISGRNEEELIIDPDCISTVTWEEVHVGKT